MDLNQRRKLVELDEIKALLNELGAVFAYQGASGPAYKIAKKYNEFLPAFTSNGWRKVSETTLASVLQHKPLTGPQSKYVICVSGSSAAPTRTVSITERRVRSLDE